MDDTDLRIKALDFAILAMAKGDIVGARGVVGAARLFLDFLREANPPPSVPALPSDIARHVRVLKA